MYYELGLISVVVAGGYWGLYFVRKQPHGTLTFGLMQLAAALLAALGLYAYRTEDAPPWMGGAGAIGLGAGIFLLVIGPAIRTLARRLAAAERLGLAGRLLDVAEVLAPGSGVAEEKAVLGAMKEIREGRIEHTIEALTLAKDRAPAEARQAIDERIAMLYLAAYRWSDAIAHAEQHLWRASEEPPPAAPAGDPQALRRALGVAPHVWVELLGAYGRTGDLDRAARMLARLEDVCEGRPDTGAWIHRARLMFLALAGRTTAVEALVEPRRARHMSPASRTYWLAVAHESRGDRAAATAAYERARGRSRGRPRALIDQALANLARADGIAGVRLSDAASEVVARVEAAPQPEVRVHRPVRPWATWGLTAAMLGVAAAITLLVGPTGDVGVLTRSGALVRGLVDGGEWWRIFSCVFVHVGGLHLVVNVIGMWFVGRIAEELFGTARTLALFGAAGFAGAVASYMASPAGISAGASGALFGLLGAVFVELTWHRERYRAAWSRGIWGGLAVVIVAQVGYGFVYPVIDQWAHGAGLVAGIALGAVLSPHAPWARAGRPIARVLATLSLAFTLIAGQRVVRTSVGHSFQRLPKIQHVVGGVAITAPAAWYNEAELAEPDGLVIVAAHRTRTDDRTAELAAWLADTAPAIARNHGFETIVPAAERRVPLPAGWEGAELIGTFADPIGYQQRYRVIACGRAFGDELVLLVVHVPDSIAAAAPAFLGRLLASVRPA